jgi:UDP-N-acetylglucosamine 3-dehydrogenase
MDKIGVGLIGCGVMGATLAASCNTLDQAQILAVSDVQQNMVDKAATELGARPFSNYQDMLALSEIDAVLVAVPGFLHRAPAVAAAQAGKHVFCEKPMAVSLEDCDAIIEACKQADRKLMIGQVCRFHGIHGRVKQLVDDGQIGEPTCMVTRRLGGGWGGMWAQKWRLERAKSGGNLLEVNAHEIDFMRWVCGNVKSVSASGNRKNDSPTDFEDIMLLNLTFENGAIGHHQSSSGSAIGEYGGRLDGTEGSLHFPAIWGEGAGIHYARFGEKTAFVPADDIVVEEPVTAELRAFAKAILNNTTPPVSGHDGRAVVEIALAAYQSAQSGELVALPMA